jgi:hypothetical protein
MYSVVESQSCDTSKDERNACVPGGLEDKRDWMENRNQTR